uniref:meiosis-specific protein MEI4 isoform X2 n=1 Tax=Scatophagus argus TaxID=75038 RepID=UPI001ED7E1A0|nr:meiosis-specific protein MEI4 isoform X2 [Scatophagus argus]
MAKRRREMESKDEHLQGESQAEWLLMKAKVALAVAIVKNKPSGLSSRQFTEVLASKLKSHDEGWKEKAQELQQEVLRLRQEVLITRVTSSTRSRTEEAAHDDPVDNASQDLFDSETPGLLSRDPQPAVSAPQPPVPCSLPHVRFLQLLCGLHRGLEPLWFHPKGDGGSVLVDSVCQLLDSVVAACRDPPRLGPRDLILQGCQVAARSMELFCSQRPPSVEFMRRVEESLRELTGTLLHRNQLSTLPAAEELTEYLFTLGSSSMSKSFLIGHVLSQISTLADQLWQAFQGQESSGLDKFPVDQYQNSCYLFWVLEKLLQSSEVPCKVKVGSELSGFLNHLEQRVFLLSDEFPLFSIYMWRIGGLLSSWNK